MGVLILEVLAKSLGLGNAWRWHWSCMSWIAQQADGDDALRLALVWPAMPYNLSGFAVRRALECLGAQLDDLTLLHDDIDLAPKRAATKETGSAGGNRGVRSVQETFETDAIRRLRFGIGRPSNGSRDPADISRHVLGDVEQELLEHWSQEAASGALHDILGIPRPAQSDNNGELM